jgi:protein-S-isoprenylcysteine O-methyltransferase Ste14
METVLWRILYGAWLATEIFLVIVMRTRQGAGTVNDRGSIYVLWVVIFSSIWIASAYGRTHPPTITMSAHWAQSTSLLLLTAGLAIRWSAIVSLGGAFSVNVAIQDDQKLHRRGVFAIVRHPSYIGMMLIFAALGLRLQNWVSLGVVVIAPLLALLYRMHVEEQALQLAFGMEYEQYRRTTKRLIPGIY